MYLKGIPYMLKACSRSQNSIQPFAIQRQRFLPCDVLPVNGLAQDYKDLSWQSDIWDHGKNMRQKNETMFFVVSMLAL